MEKEKLVIDLIRDGLSQRKTNREDNYIHASDLTKWCARRYVLCEKLNRPFHHKKYIPHCVSLTYYLGERIEDIVTEVISKSRYIGSQDKVVKGIYLEERHKDLVLTGSIDIGLLINSVFIPVEVKSISPEGFDELAQPKIEHKTQLMVYLYMLTNCKTITGYSYPSGDKMVIDLKETGFRKSPQGVVVYVCKTQKPEPIKVYLVEFESDYRKKIKSVFKEVISGRRKLPPKVCVHQGSTMARECPEVNFCFEAEG